jgi:hypothetical protein
VNCSVTAVERLRVPLVPVIVTRDEGAATLLAVLTVSVEELPVVLFGLKLAVAPDGRPVAASATALEKPPVRASVTMYVVLLPGRIERLDGDALRVKSGAGGGGGGGAPSIAATSERIAGRVA